MHSINLLGLKAVGATAVVMLVLLGIYTGARQLAGPSAPTASPTSVPDTTPAPAPDADGDGLPDAFEALYQTDPQKADTDADGTNDLDEITAGTNPTIPGPNDEVKPPTGEAADLTTYTGRYLASLPNDAPREEVLKQERLEAFVNLNKGDLLPIIPAEQILSTPNSGQEAISSYLDSISSAQNPALAAVTNEDVSEALRQGLSNTQSTSLPDLTKKLENNLSIIKSVPAPAEVRSLHTQYVAASQALLDAVKLLATMLKGDFVGGLIGAKKIEELGPVFQDISTQIQALEAKYGLE